MGAFVFISYSHADAGKYVDELAIFLGRAGIQVWYDKEIIHGDRWLKMIQRQIDACVAVIAVMTPAANDSEWVERELMHALKARKPVLPLLLSGEESFLLTAHHFDDVSDRQMPSSAFVSRLKGIVSMVDSDVRAAEARIEEEARRAQQTRWEEQVRAAGVRKADEERRAERRIAEEARELAQRRSAEQAIPAQSDEEARKTAALDGIRRRHQKRLDAAERMKAALAARVRPAEPQPRWWQRAIDARTPFIQELKTDYRSYVSRQPVRWPTHTKVVVVGIAVLLMVFAVPLLYAMADGRLMTASQVGDIPSDQRSDLNSLVSCSGLLMLLPLVYWAVESSTQFSSRPRWVAWAGIALPAGVLALCCSGVPIFIGP